MSISIDRYVSITSGVAGAQAVAQRELVGLRFSTDPRVPVGELLSFEKGGVDALLGADSPEAVFASQYFGYISPAPASQAQKLRVAAWVDVDRAPQIFGVRTDNLLNDYKAVTDGSLALTMGSYQAELTGIDLSTVTSLADVASAVQDAIQAEVDGGAQWGEAAVAFDAVEGVFTLQGGEAVNAAIDIEESELAELLGWSQPTAILSPGSLQQSPVEALQAVDSVNDSFGSFCFPSITVEEAVAAAQFNAGLNVKYMFLVSVGPNDAEDYFAALSAIASVGLVLNDKPGEYKEALPMAIMAATNYQRRNATVNYMYRQGLYTQPYDVTSNGEADRYDKMRVSYYGETSNAGQKLAFFQRGFLQGGATAPLDMNVHANEQWLKAYLTAQLLSMQLSLGKIPANLEGRGMVLSQVVAAANLGKFNGTISVGKTITVSQQLALTQLTGDPDAWRAVQANGYWADVEIVERTGESGATEYVAQYTLAYAKNDVVRKIEGSHNLI